MVPNGIRIYHASQKRQFPTLSPTVISKKPTTGPRDIRISDGTAVRTGFLVCTQTPRSANRAIGESNLTDRAGAQGRQRAGLYPFLRQISNLFLSHFRTIFMVAGAGGGGWWGGLLPRDKDRESDKPPKNECRSRIHNYTIWMYYPRFGWIRQDLARCGKMRRDLIRLAQNERCFGITGPYIANDAKIPHDSAGMCNIWNDMSGLARFGVNCRDRDVFTRSD